MNKILYVDACVRGMNSRTRKLATYFLEQYRKKHPADIVETRDLCTHRLEPQYPEVLEERDRLWTAGKLQDPMFAPAHQFAEADKIVIAAPFWDLSFPAILKIYLERISVTNITFGYSDTGAMKGLCRAKKLLLITTRGGYYRGSPLEMGRRQLEALCQMYGIPEIMCLDAEGMDDDRNNPGSLLAQAMERAESMAENF